MLVLKGFDTETTSDGKARVVATNKKAIRVNSFEDIAEFLRPSSKSTTIYETWNLGYDSRAIIKWLPIDIWESIYKKEDVEYNGYKIKALGSKRFSIGYKYGQKKERWRYAHLYDIASFYGYQKLEAAASQYLGKHKKDMAGWVEAVNKYQNVEDELRYLDQHEEGVKYYCRLDAELAKELAEYMFNALEAIGVDTSNPISQAALAAKLMTQKNTNYPDSCWEETEQFTKATFRGGFFNCLIRGKIDQPVYEYDIKSAYPAEQWKLPHWGNGEFQFTDDENEMWAADYGWVMATFDCEWIPYPTPYAQTIEVDYSDNKGFNKYLLNNKIVMYPTGKRTQAITLHEAKWMRQRGFPVKLHMGLIWNQTCNDYPNPFEYLRELYHERQRIIKENGKEDMRQYAIKIILNSTYGKTVQDPEKYGYRAPTTDFGYGSYITARTRTKVADVAMNHKGKVIEIATDAVYLLEEAPELDTSGELGSWELVKYNSGLWIGVGVKQLYTDDGYKTKARGFTNDRKFNLETALKCVAQEEKYAHYKNRPLTLGEILRTVNNPGLFRPDLMNRFMPVGRRISVNMDRKRLWEVYPKNWDEFFNAGLIHSRPWTVTELNEGQHLWAPERLRALGPLKYVLEVETDEL